VCRVGGKRKAGMTLTTYYGRLLGSDKVGLDPLFHAVRNRRASNDHKH